MTSKMKLDEATLIIDQFTDFVMDAIGQTVQVSRHPDQFCLEICKPVFIVDPEKGRDGRAL